MKGNKKGSISRAEQGKESRQMVMTIRKKH